MASQAIQTPVAMLRENPPIQGDDPRSIRESMEASVGAFPLPEGTRSEPVDGGSVPAEWMSTPGAREDRALLYLHGGGYVIGSLDTHRGLAARLALRDAGDPLPAAAVLLSPWTDLAGTGESLRSRAVDVDLEVWEERVHVFQAFAPLLPEADQAIGRVGADLQERWP